MYKETNMPTDCLSGKIEVIEILLMSFVLVHKWYRRSSGNYRGRNVDVDEVETKLNAFFTNRTQSESSNGNIFLFGQ